MQPKLIYTVKKQENYYPCALTIAGSDSCGGAGIQADLRTFSAIGVYGCSAVTAVTAQTPGKVSRVDVMPPEAVSAQVEGVLSCFRIAAIKTGMLCNSSIIRAVAASLGKYEKKIPLVIDPVMISTSGHELLEEEAVAVLKKELFPLAAWITPNLPEAEFLLSRKLPDMTARIKAAEEIATRWKCSCYLKTGHDLANKEEACDIVVHNKRVYTLTSPVIPDTKATHGTGCTLSSAIAGLLAAGNSWKDCVCEAKAFVYGSILEAAIVGPKCEAMYPPLENYRPLTAIAEWKGRK